MSRSERRTDPPGHVARHGSPGPTRVVVGGRVSRHAEEGVPGNHDVDTRLDTGVAGIDGEGADGHLPTDALGP